jgi:electron transfer flavoprotein beta subunit
MTTIVVCVKQVGTLSDEVELIDDDHRVDPDYLDLSLNEWDACAVEEAVRLREAAGGDVIAVTTGDDEADDVLVRCLAMGANRAIRVECPGFRDLDALAVARALASAIAPLHPGLVLCGAQSSDSAQSCTGPALAAVLELPCVAVATRLVGNAASDALVVHRELEGGLIDVVEADLPAVITVQTGINEPRYVTLRAIQQARETEIDVVPSTETEPVGYRLLRLAPPPRENAAPLGSDARTVAAAITAIVKAAAT